MSRLRSRLRGLTTQLMTWIVLPTLLALAFVTYEGVTLHERDMHNLVSERDNRAVRAAAAGLADRFSQRRLVLQTIASRLGDKISLQQLLTDDPELRTVFDGGLIVTDNSGNVTDSWLPGMNWTSTLRSTSAPWVVDHDNGTPLVIANDHSPNSALTVYGGISLSSLNVPATIGIISDSPQTQFYLIADDSHLLDNSAGIAIGTNVRDIVTLDTSHIAVQDLITVWSKVEGLNWTLFVQEPWEDVITPGLQMSLVAPLAAAPAILLAVAILLFGLMRVVLPLRRLGLATQRLTWGDYAVIEQPVGGVQEIHDLQIALSHMAKRVQQMQSSMHSYIGAVMQGQEEERKRLSHELHDDTVQSLIALDQKRQMVQRSLEPDPAKASEFLEQLHQMIDETINGLRKLIRDMRPSYLEDLGLTPALEMLSTQLSTSDMTVAFSGDATPNRLPANQELNLYRIAQEAITNAMHHAKATKVQVGLHYDDGVTLWVEDNGSGFTIPERPDIFAQSGHYGLMGMVERAEQIGAQFRIDSMPGGGTRIEVHIPKT
jgi:signal transduction histidine kinase